MKSVSSDHDDLQMLSEIYESVESSGTKQVLSENLRDLDGEYAGGTIDLSSQPMVEFVESTNIKSSAEYIELMKL